MAESWKLYATRLRWQREHASEQRGRRWFAMGADHRGTRPKADELQPRTVILLHVACCVGFATIVASKTSQLPGRAAIRRREAARYEDLYRAETGVQQHQAAPSEGGRGEQGRPPFSSLVLEGLHAC